MKYKKYLHIFITCIAVLIFSQYCAAQTNTDEKEAKKTAFKNMVDSQHFTFVAQSVTPLRGRFRNLTSSYDVRLFKDSMISFLPYFGRAYSAPLDPTESPLNFTSTDFTYTVTPHKKNGWNVVIKPNDKSGVQQFSFTIFSNGTASLNVVSSSKDPISFNGYIEKAEKK
jgi:hypothetical protein